MFKEHGSHRVPRAPREFSPRQRPTPNNNNNNDNNNDDNNNNNDNDNNNKHNNNNNDDNNKHHIHTYYYHYHYYYYYYYYYYYHYDYYSVRFLDFCREGFCSGSRLRLTPRSLPCSDGFHVSALPSFQQPTFQNSIKTQRSSYSHFKRFLCFKRISEMRVVEMIVRPPYEAYTQFAVEDSCPIGPNPWTFLVQIVYLLLLSIKKGCLGNPTLGTNLGQRILAMRTGRRGSSQLHRSLPSPPAPNDAQRSYIYIYIYIYT